MRVLVLTQFVRNPEPGEAPEPKTSKVQRTDRSYITAEMLRSPIFRLLYLLDGLMCAGELIVSANLAPIAAAFDITSTVVLGTGALAVAPIVANIMNGLARPFFAWVSDEIGHTMTMAIAFAIGAGAYYALGEFGSNPWMFIFCVGSMFFCWGEIFSLYPAMCTDLFGDKYATMSERLGVSRTPIREAISVLEQEGLVRSIPRRGVVVVRKSKREIVVWAAIEAMAARLAGPQVAADDIAELHTYVDAFREHPDEQISEYSEANMAFHRP